MDSACAGTSQAGGLGGYRLVGGYGLRGCGLVGCAGTGWRAAGTFISVIFL